MSTDELRLRVLAETDSAKKNVAGLRGELKALEKARAEAFSKGSATGDFSEVRRLQTEIDKTKGAYIKATAEAKKFNAQLRSLDGPPLSAIKKVEQGWVKMTKAFENPLIGALSIGAMVAFGRSAVEAFTGAEKAQTQLQLAFSKFPALADTSLEKMKQLNEEMITQKGVGIESTASAETSLARFGLSGTQIQKMLPLINDYSVAAGTDLPSAAMAVGKAMLGNARALKSVGIEFKATGNSAKDVSTIMADLQKNVGGASDAFMNTSAGQLQKAKAEFQAMQETIGGSLVPALTATNSLMTPIFQGFSSLPSPLRATTIMLAGVGVAAMVATPRIMEMNKALAQSQFLQSRGLSGIGGMAAKAGAGVGIAALGFGAVGWLRDQNLAQKGTVPDTVGTIAAMAGVGAATGALLGPIGAVVGTLVGAGVGAWMVWGNAASDANTKVLESTKAGQDALRAQTDAVNTAALAFQNMGDVVTNVNSTMTKWKNHQAYLDALRTFKKSGKQSDFIAAVTAGQTDAASYSNKYLAAKHLFQDETSLQNAALGMGIRGAKAFTGKTTQPLIDASRMAMMSLVDANRKSAASQKIVDTTTLKAVDSVNLWKRQVDTGTLSVQGFYTQLNALESKIPNLANMLNQNALPKVTGAQKSQGRFPARAMGGMISGPGHGTSDTAGLFALSNGEHVTRAAATARLGAGFMSIINNADALSSQRIAAMKSAAYGSVASINVPQLVGAGIGGAGVQAGGFINHGTVITHDPEELARAVAFQNSRQALIARERM